MKYNLRKILQKLILVFFIIVSLLLIVSFIGCAYENTLEACEDHLLFLFILDLILFFIYKFLLKSKVFFIIVITLIVLLSLYLLIVRILYFTDFCPSYINCMPPLGGSSSLSPLQEFFCPFTEKVY